MSTHVIFDLGQTIADGIGAYNEIFKDHANSLGKEWTYTDYSEVENLDEICYDFLFKIEDHRYKYPDEVAQMSKRLADKVIVNGCKMMPGSEKLLRHLHDYNIPMAIASNGKIELCEFTISKVSGLNREWFTHVVGGADDPEVKNNKPAPDIYWVTAKRFNPPPKSMDRCVVFEDSIRGITGAVESGMKTVLINAIPVHELGAIADKITVIVDSLENFRPESVGLPPYQ